MLCCEFAWYEFDDHLSAREPPLKKPTRKLSAAGIWSQFEVRHVIDVSLSLQRDATRCEKVVSIPPIRLSQISHYAAIPAAAGVGLSARPHVDQGDVVAISVVEHSGVFERGSV